MLFRGRSKRAEEPGHEARDSPEDVLLDGATGLHKGWYFERRLDEEVQRCARYGRVFALVLWEPRLLPGEVMEDEVMRVVPPLLEQGGVIPGCDHGVPPDISWPNFVEYSRLLAKLTGWL